MLQIIFGSLPLLATANDFLGGSGWRNGVGVLYAYSMNFHIIRNGSPSLSAFPRPRYSSSRWGELLGFFAARATTSGSSYLAALGLNQVLIISNTNKFVLHWTSRSHFMTFVTTNAGLSKILLKLCSRVPLFGTNNP